jgi:hypothetical protein
VGRVVFPLPVQDLFSVLEVTETANCGTTGLATPTQAVPSPLSTMILGQWLARVAVGARFGLHGFGRHFLPESLSCRPEESSCQPPSVSR